MKLMLLVFLFVATSVIAQEVKKKPPVKRANQTAHTKATPEQVRKFKQLEEKEKQKR